MTKSDLKNLTTTELSMLKGELPRLIAQSSPLLASVLNKIKSMITDAVNIKPGDKVKFKLDGTTGVVNKINGELLEVTDEYHIQRAWGVDDVDLVENDKTDNNNLFKFKKPPFKEFDIDNIDIVKRNRKGFREWVKDNEPKTDKYDIERWAKNINIDDDMKETVDLLDKLRHAQWEDYTRKTAQDVLLKIINKYDDEERAIAQAVNIAMELTNELKIRLRHE